MASPWDIGGAFQSGQLNEITRQEKLADLSMKPLQQEELVQKLQTGQLGMQSQALDIQAKEIANDKQKQIQDFYKQKAASQKIAQQSQAAQTAQNTQPDSSQQMADLASGMMSDAQQMYGMGLYEEADKLVKQASTLSSNVSKINSQTQMAQQHKIESAQKGYKLMQDTLGSAYDAQSFEDAKREVREETGQPTPYDALPYSPKLVDYIKNTAKTAHQQSEEASKQKEIQLRAADTQSKIETRKFHEEIATRKTAAYESRIDTLNKAGGIPKTAPTSDDIKFAKAKIMQEFPEYGALKETDLPGPLKSSLYMAASNIAIRTKQLMLEHNKLTPQEARERAFAESKNNGDWDFMKGKDPMKIMGHAVPGTGANRGPATYNPSGKSANAPIEGAPAPEKRVVGRYYKNAQGAVMQWQGTGWSKVTAGAVKAPPSAPTPPETSTGVEESEGEDE